jgi:endophilin-A
MDLELMISGEVEEECVMRGEQISNLEQDQYAGLTDLLEAELEYFSKCKEILEELKDGWPSA